MYVLRVNTNGDITLRFDDFGELMAFAQKMVDSGYNVVITKDYGEE